MIKKVLLGIVLMSSFILTGCSKNSNEYVEMKDDGIYLTSSKSFGLSKNETKLLVDNWDGFKGEYKDPSKKFEAQYYVFEGRYVDFDMNKSGVRENDMDKFKDSLYGEFYLDTQGDILFKLDGNSKLVCQFTTYDKDNIPLESLKQGFYDTVKALTKFKPSVVRVGDLELSLSEEDNFFLIKNKKIVDSLKLNGVVKVSSNDVKTTEDVTLPNGTILQKGSNNGKVFYLYNGYKIFTSDIENIKEIKK